MDDRFLFDPETESLPAGVLICGLTSTVGRSATLDVVRHRGASVHYAAGGWRRIVMPEVTVVRAGIYSASIVGNGWEPYDQHSPAAYLPLRWSDLRVFAQTDGLELYVETRPRRGSAAHFVTVGAEHSFTFAVTQPVELRRVARHLAATTGAHAQVILSMLKVMLEQPGDVTRVAA